MGSIYKTLQTSNVATLPYVAKKVSELSPCDGNNLFRAYRGKYTPKDWYLTSSSLDAESVLYLAVENLYYKGFISQSNQSGSFTDLKLQTIGSKESFQQDIRQYNQTSDVKVVSINQEAYGEKVSPKTFSVISDIGDYYIIDDGLGNLIDIINFNPTQLSESDIYSSDFIFNYYQVSSSIGNIIYNQGILIITNPFYYCIFDAGAAIVENYTEVFLTTDDKQIFLTPIAESDCTDIDFNSIVTIPVSGSSFPNFTINESGVITLDPNDPLYNTPGTYYIDYYLLSQACAPSNTARITITIVECIVEGASAVEQLPPAPTPTVTRTPNPSSTPNASPTPTITPNASPTPTPDPIVPIPTPTQTPSQTPTNTPTIGLTPTPSVTQTLTPAPTSTPTRTPTQTPTRTPTMTPSPNPPNSSTFRLGATESLSCYGELITLYWNASQTLGIGTRLFYDSDLTIPVNSAAAVTLDTSTPGGVDGNVDGSVFLLTGNQITLQSAYYCNEYVFPAVVSNCWECGTGPYTAVNVVTKNWYPSSLGYYTDELQTNKSIQLLNITSGSVINPNIYEYVLNPSFGPYSNCNDLQIGIFCDISNP